MKSLHTSKLFKTTYVRYRDQIRHRYSDILTSVTTSFSSEIPEKSALAVNISINPISFRMLIREYDVFRESLGT